MVFPVVMYGCESWTVNKAECRRTDAFELWCWRGLLRVPWTVRRSNQSILKEISPEYSLKGLMLKLKLQYFGHLMGRTDSLEKILILGKTEGRRRRGWQRMRWLDGIIDSTWVWVNSRSWWWTGRPGVLQFMGSQRVGHDWATGVTDWSDVNRWFPGKVPNAGKDWEQKEKRVPEDETVLWHCQINGQQLGQTLVDDEGQGGLVFFSPWGGKESDMTGLLNSNNSNRNMCPKSLW